MSDQGDAMELRVEGENVMNERAKSVVSQPLSWGYSATADDARRVPFNNIQFVLPNLFQWTDNSLRFDSYNNKQIKPSSY